jgi:hypothetical protein
MAGAETGTSGNESRVVAVFGDGIDARPTSKNDPKITRIVSQSCDIGAWLFQPVVALTSIQGREINQWSRFGGALQRHCDTG